MDLQEHRPPRYTFLLEHSKGEEQSAEENALLQALAFWRWKSSSSLGTHTHRSQDDFSHYAVAYADVTDMKVGPTAIPVGSVEFTNRLLVEAGYAPMRAINVPEELASPLYLQRQIWRFPNFRTAKDSKSLPCGGYLVKPDDTPKAFDTTLVRNLSRLMPGDIPEDKPVFVSELLQEPIDAEWRVFVLRNEIIDARPYILTKWRAPDKRVVNAMMLAWRDAPPAYTLDVAVLADGMTVLLEAHNFIACGLYGLEPARLIPMLISAWQWELRRQNAPLRPESAAPTSPEG